jgi:hypothetical protein
MIRSILKSQLAAFQKKWGYDASYAQEVVDADPMAIFALFMVGGMLDRKGAPAEVRHAVKLLGVMTEDCGPCSQLAVQMALADGVDPAVLRAVVARDFVAMPADVALAVRFAEASLAHAPEADEPREEIVRRWGQRGLVSLAFALATARVYPTLKYTLGHGKACTRLEVAGQTVNRPVRLGIAA